MVAPYIEAVRERGSAANPFFQLMRITINAFDAGEAILSMPIRPDMLNGEGWLQGGLFVALADIVLGDAKQGKTTFLTQEAMALALYTVLEGTERAATVSESTNFLKGIQSGTVVATGRVIRKRRRIAFLESEVRDATGEVLSRTSATFMIC